MSQPNPTPASATPTPTTPAPAVATATTTATATSTTSSSRPRSPARTRSPVRVRDPKSGDVYNYSGPDAEAQAERMRESLRNPRVYTEAITVSQGIVDHIGGNFDGPRETYFEHPDYIVHSTFHQPHAVFHGPVSQGLAQPHWDPFRMPSGASVIETRRGEQFTVNHGTFRHLQSCAITGSHNKIEDATICTITGSHNVISGTGNNVTGSHNTVTGANNTTHGPYNTVNGAATMPAPAVAITSSHSGTSSTFNQGATSWNVTEANGYRIETRHQNGKTHRTVTFPDGHTEEKTYDGQAPPVIF